MDDYKKYTSCIDEEWKEDDNFGFGHNCEFDFLPIFKKLDKMGVVIDIKSDYEIDLYLPEPNDDTNDRENILIYILTKLPGSSNASYNKKKNKLNLEWHF